MVLARTGLWILALSTASLLLLASTVARANGVDEDGDGVADEFELQTRRNILSIAVPDVNPTALTIKSSSVGAPTDDLFRIRYEAGEFEVEYSRIAAADEVTSSYSLDLEKLIEWVDENGDGLLQPEEIVNSTTLGSSAFGDSLVVPSGGNSPDGGHVDAFVIRSVRAEITLVLTIAERFLRVSPERVLTPMEAKLDIYVNHTFERPGARIGLELRIETSYRMEYGSETWDDAQGFSEDDTWISMTGGSGPEASTVFFSWANRSVADGAEKPVTVMAPREVEPGSQSYAMYILYPSGSNAGRVSVLHDPTLGVVSAAYEGILRSPPPPRLQGDPSLYGISLAAIAAIVIATVVLAARRRRRS